jgi:hypothetical protein
VVRFEIDALHDRGETLTLKEHALHRALVRKGVLTMDEWNSAVTEVGAEIAIQQATADITSGPVQERQAVTADLEMYWAAAQEPADAPRGGGAKLAALRGQNPGQSEGGGRNRPLLTTCLYGGLDGN